MEDLLSQMTLEEKAGMMFINGTFVNDDGAQGFAARLPSAPKSINELKRCWQGRFERVVIGQQ